MRVRGKSLLEDMFLIAGSLTGLALVWYGFFVLRKATLPQAIFASLAFGSGVLAGLVGLTVKRDEPRWFIIDWRRLSRRQSFLMGIGGLMLAIYSLWLVLSGEIPILGGIVGKLMLVLGFFYFCWQSFLRFKHAFREGTERKAIEGKP